MSALCRISSFSAHARPYSSAAKSRLSGALTIGLIPADGIGKEVIPATVDILKHIESSSPDRHWNFKFVNLEAGFELFQRTGVALPQKTIDLLKNECVGGLFGAVSSPSHKVAGYSSPIVALRKHLDLYANVRPVAAPNGAYNARGERKPCDMVIVRENTECLYIKQETSSTSPSGVTTALATRRITSTASERIGRIAFELALQRHARRSVLPASQNWWRAPPKVTIVHKSNVMSVTDGLFRESVLSIGKEKMYKNVQVEEQLVDSMVYRLFREPHAFDVVVAPNLYGDILSDGAAALVGSLGVVPSANVGDSFVLGEPVHGSAPDIQGQSKANPIAAIRSAALLLEHLNLPAEAQRIYTAVDNVLNECDKNVLTPDMGGKGKTGDVVRAVVRKL